MHGMYCFIAIKSVDLNYNTRKYAKSDFPGQVNFAFGQVKIQVQCPGGQVKLVSIVL